MEPERLIEKFSIDRMLLRSRKGHLAEFEKELLSKLFYKSQFGANGKV